MAMVAFKTAYRDAGFIPSEDELPDYLPMVLDFAALTGRGQRLLRSPPGRPRTAAPRAGQGRIPVRRTSSPPSAPSCPGWAAVNSARCSPPGSPGRRARRSASNRSRRRTTWPADRAEPVNATAAAAVLVGGPALPGARRVHRRPRLAVALRPVRLDQPLHPAAGTPPAQVGRPAVPLRHVRRHRRARHRHPDPGAVDQGDRHPRGRLPLVLASARARSRRCWSSAGSWCSRAGACSCRGSGPPPPRSTT